MYKPVLICDNFKHAMIHKRYRIKSVRSQRNNSLATIERLLDMDVEKYLLASSLTGIVSQKLARKLCPKCKSTNITRIRRVSGYLEILDGFTNGKKNEVKARRAN